MLTDEAAAPIIDAALDRLDVPENRRACLRRRIQNVSIMASFHMPPVGQRVTPKQIMAALNQIEQGVRALSAGLELIDGASRTMSPNASRRAESLSLVQHGILGALADAVIRSIPPSRISDDQVVDSMPSYGYLSFQNTWTGAFSIAASRIKALCQAFDANDFKVPTRDKDERFIRAVKDLAAIYEDAAGREAKAYSPSGDTTKQGWRAPFVQFVSDLWPLLKGDDEPAPSSRRIADALKDTSVLPQAGHA